LRQTDVAIIIPWHGAITVGSDVGEAAALHATFAYAAQLDVTLSATQAEPMPVAQCAHVRALIEQADYLTLTWELMKRKVERQHRGALV
jgi:L-fuculose-phosphate aldolase